MSSQGPRRQPPPGAGRSGHRRAPRPAGQAAPLPRELLAGLLREARELLAVRSPLDAELIVSKILGTWWEQPASSRRPANAPDLERLVGERLVEHASRDGSPAALALLTGIAGLGTPRQASLAERAALRLMEQGVARPAWADRVGAVAVQACYLNPDRHGDHDEAVCVFNYAGQEAHALVLLVDYNAGGMLRDGWVTSEVATLLERGGLGKPEGPGRTGLRPIPAGQARRLLDSALRVTQTAPGPPVSDSFAAYHAFIRARVRALPPADPGADVIAPPCGGPAARLADSDDRSGWIGVLARRLAWSSDRRAMLVAEFLAADEAEGLSDSKAASRCADHIADYGCDQDFGRPLRMSPTKAEAFLLGWLPRKIMLTPAEQHAMPHVLAAWTRWAGRRRGQDARTVDETVDAVLSAMGTFAKVYPDPAAFGLDGQLVARLLPDADLEALPRRAFAFPVLRGSYEGVDLSTLDPAEPDARRTLLAADHDDVHGRPLNDQHLARHLVLSDRLWRGDPPELWDAAQRMLDRGEDRHAIQHTLMYLIRDVGDDTDRLAAELAALP